MQFPDMNTTEIRTRSGQLMRETGNRLRYSIGFRIRVGASYGIRFVHVTGVVERCR